MAAILADLLGESGELFGGRVTPLGTCPCSPAHHSLVETPYALMDAESRTNIEGGVEIPLRGNGLLTDYAYLFATRAHVLDEDLYLRLVIPPG